MKSSKHLKFFNIGLYKSPKVVVAGGGFVDKGANCASGPKVFATEINPVGAAIDSLFPSSS